MAKQVLLWMGPDRVLSHNTIAAMLADANAGAQDVLTRGYFAKGDCGWNLYYLDTSDTTSTPNGITILPGISGTMSLDATGTFDGVNGTYRYKAIDCDFDPVKAGADKTGAVEATKFFLAAMKAARNPSSINVTPGTYLIDELDWPEKWLEVDFQKSWLTTTATATYVMDVTTANDNNRPGPIKVTRLYINGTGSAAGLIGLQSTTQSVGPIIENVNIKNCDVACYVVGSLNLAIRDSIFHRNTTGGVHTNGVGLYLQDSVDNSSSNVLEIENCEFYINEVGLILDGTRHVAGVVEGINLINCTIQSNDQCGLAAFNVKRIYDRGGYFEANGNSPDPNVTVNIDPLIGDLAIGGDVPGSTADLVIPKVAIYLDNSEFISDTISGHDSVQLANGASISYPSGLAQKNFNSIGVAFRTDGSACKFKVQHFWTANQTCQALVEAVPFDFNFNVKCGFLQPYRPTADNNYGLVNVSGSARDIKNTMLERQTSGGTVPPTDYKLDIADSSLINRVRHEIQFASGAAPDSTGSTTNNFFLFRCNDVNDIADGEECVWQFPVRLETGTGPFEVTFDFATGTLNKTTVWITDEWQVLTLCVRNNGGVSRTAAMYVYPKGTDGPHLHVGGAMIHKVLVGGDRDPVKRIVSQQVWVPTFDDWVMEDDFTQKAINETDENWILNSGTDAAALDPAIVVAENGTVFLDAGIGDGSMAEDGSQLVYAIPIQLTNGVAEFEARIKIEDITGCSVNIGLTDTTALEEPFSGSADTITSVASNAVAFVFDDGNTTKEWFVAGVDGDTDATGVKATGVAPVNDTYQTLRCLVGRRGESAVFLIDGVKVGELTASVSANTTNLYLTATICGDGGNSSAVGLTIDWIKVSAGRPL